MSINVYNVLDLPSFKDAKILAGHSALDNIVTQVSISDSPLSEFDYKIAYPGDFYLSEFYFAKDSSADMITYLEPILMAGGSGICILDEYINELPDSIIDYCNNNKFPVILNSVNIPYAIMIREIMELIIADRQNTLLSKEISSIIDATIDQRTQMRIINQINPHLHNNITAFYITLTEPHDSAPEIRDYFERDIFASGIMFNEGVLGIISHPAADKASAQVAYYIDKLMNFNGIKSIGISDAAIKLHDVSKAFNQAITAAKFNSHEGDIVQHYRDLGTMKLFLLLAGHPELEEFYNEIIGSLVDYDKKHNSQLFETMLMYKKCGYQYKDVAGKLFVHENTVRYRINKAQEIITEKSPRDDFKETFSMALQIKCILERNK